MKKKDVLAFLKKMHDQYFDLVWYARNGKKRRQQSGQEDIRRIRGEHPDAVAALAGESGDWHHGVNSGCLATVRLMEGLMGTASDAQEAKKTFPDLNT